MSRIIRSYIVDIVETDDVIYCDNDGHLTYNIEADRNELVRCKDCKYWKNEHLCLAWSRFGSIETKAEQFCSYGERRE